jgi:hypothetical protein
MRNQYKHITDTQKHLADRCSELNELMAVNISITYTHLHTQEHTRKIFILPMHTFVQHRSEETPRRPVQRADGSKHQPELGHTARYRRLLIALIIFFVGVDFSVVVNLRQVLSDD